MAIISGLKAVVGNDILDCGYVICIIYEVLLKSDLGCGYVICIILVAVLLRW